MEQSLRQNLEDFHKLFDGSRCESFLLEELVYKSIQSDNTTNHHATWQGRKHDSNADIRVRTNGECHDLEIKSGKLHSDGSLRLSGHRLTKFDKNLSKVTEYLNSIDSEILSIPYRKIEDETGRHHIYRIVYVDRLYFGTLTPDGWETVGKQLRQTTEYGVLFSISESLSSQVWWTIPEQLLDMSDEFTIGH